MAEIRSRPERAIVTREFLREIETAFEEMVKDFGEILSNFSLAHWKILMSVWRHSGEISQTEAKKLIKDFPKLQSDQSRRELIKQLAKSGMITKSVDPNDERRIVLSITDRAMPKIESYMTRVEASIKKYAPKLK
eukprot:TRINITY_DN49444_c0_g1_i1.p1 TRINITY_DN49444_c0_g1~~TRINITY_DN49444_c0_g1_i1.p1  ORF type:complete len:135 (-),score=11.65 TRINITY_DN49444_c0_g1_i1:209-613(-)